MEKYGFFSSINEDRLYTADDFSDYFGRFLTSGYFPNTADKIDSSLRVTANGTLELTTEPGVAWINGRVYELTEPKTLKVDVEANLSRRDRVVIRCDFVERCIYTTIKKGTPSDNPEFPALDKNTDIHELCIAQYQIDKGVTQIQQSQIVDTRKDIDLCGEVTSILDKRTLKEFAHISGFTMEGDIRSRNIVPAEAGQNIGTADSRYNKIYCNELNTAVPLPFLPIEGGSLEGDITTKSIIPIVSNKYQLGTEANKFAEAHIRDLNVYGTHPFLNRAGGTVTGGINSNYAPEAHGKYNLKVNTAWDNNAIGDGHTYIGYNEQGHVMHYFRGTGNFVVGNPVLKAQELEAKGLTVNGKKLYIQTEAPADAKDGDVWIEV